jgi:hypothetical protein
MLSELKRQALAATRAPRPADTTDEMMPDLERHR